MVPFLVRVIIEKEFIVQVKELLDLPWVDMLSKVMDLLKCMKPRARGMRSSIGKIRFGGKDYR